MISEVRLDDVMEYTYPHWPQISQQALRGHSFNVFKSVPGGAVAVSFTCGPQTALGMLAGIEG